MAFKPIGIAAGNVLQLIARGGELPELVQSEDEAWQIEICHTEGFIRLWHKESNTASRVHIGLDSTPETDTFVFLGAKTQDGYAQKRVPNVSVWEQRHRKMFGLSQKNKSS